MGGKYEDGRKKLIESDNAELMKSNDKMNDLFK